MLKTYPVTGEQNQKDNPAIQIYGNRFHADQSLYEYLVEFLLIFSSAKDIQGNGKLAFHEGIPGYYFVEPRNGFRRFIFFNRAKKSKVAEDDAAYNEIIRILKEHIDASKDKEKEEYLLAVQELFRGYAAVLKKRTWCAQSLLPMCPEMIFCEQMPNDKYRLKGVTEEFEDSIDSRYDPEATFYDASFDLTRHNFLARGGEMYYLHLMKALEGDNEKKHMLQNALVNLLTNKSASFSQLANWVQHTWEEEKRIDPNYLCHKMNIGYIPAEAYQKSGKNSVDELLIYLSNELHPVKRIELLAKGIMFQVMRMQLEQTAAYLHEKEYPIIIDMRSKKGGTVIRQISVNSFNLVADAFTSAIHQCISENRGSIENIDTSEEYATFIKAKDESLDIFRSKGKELQCIIPMNGPFERFSLSEDIVRFLVLSIVRPGTRMDLNNFLSELYHHFNLVIGPDEYMKVAGSNTMDRGLVNCFIYNKEAFQNFLKSAGFLRDLSDATSIVVNPYKEVELL